MTEERGHADGVIETSDGKLIDVFKFRPEDYDLNVVASSLSKLCRFNGHCTRFYSVAEHAVLVARMMYEQFVDRSYDYVLDIPYEPLDREAALKVALWGLHHDDAEAYVGDTVRPLKTNNHRSLEANILRGCASALDLSWPVYPVVKRFDDVALAVEARLLMMSGGKHWSWIEEVSEETYVRIMYYGMLPLHVDSSAPAGLTDYLSYHHKLHCELQETRAS